MNEIFRNIEYFREKYSELSFYTDIRDMFGSVQLICGVEYTNFLYQKDFSSYVLICDLDEINLSKCYEIVVQNQKQAQIKNKFNELEKDFEM